MEVRLGSYPYLVIPSRYLTDHPPLTNSLTHSFTFFCLCFSVVRCLQTPFQLLEPIPRLFSLEGPVFQPKIYTPLPFPSLPSNLLVEVVSLPWASLFSPSPSLFFSIFQKRQGQGILYKTPSVCTAPYRTFNGDWGHIWDLGRQEERELPILLS